MLKRVAMLWLALLMAGGSLAIAAERPSSMDRHLAPDEFPTNVVKILRTSNKAQTNSYVPVVFTMINNNPFNVIRFLRRAIEPEEGLLFTFVNPEGNGGKVLFVAPEYMVESLRELVDSVDKAGVTTSAGDKRIYRQLKHRRVDEFGHTDDAFLDTARSFSTGNGSDLIEDSERNALFFEDAPSGAQALDGALTEWLDVPTAMVHVMVKIYELDTYNDGKLGLDYMAWKNTLGQDLFVVGGFAERGSADGSGVPKTGFSADGYNYAYKYQVTSEFFDFLQAKGKARLMNKAQLAALNSRTATLSSGDQVLYYSVQTAPTSGVRDSGQIFQANGSRTVTGTGNMVIDGQIVPVETGLSLEVTPTIGEESVQMDVELSWSDYVGFDSTGFPQINGRSLKSELRMKVGEEIVLGGLTRQIRASSTQKAPVIGSLPIVGYLFGGETEINKNSEMVVSIQPVAVVNYDLAGDYKVKDCAQMVIDQAAGDAKVELPKTTWGFDMYGLDNTWGEPVEPVK